MIWISRIGLALICLFLMAWIFVRPADFMEVLQWLGMVAVLGLWAEGTRLDRLGKSAFAGFSKRRIAVLNLGMGILCALLTILALTRGSYFVAAYNAFGALLFLPLGVMGLFLVPNRTVERDARKSSARPSP